MEAVFSSETSIIAYRTARVITQKTTVFIFTVEETDVSGVSR
jgi:hypothetical protein